MNLELASDGSEDTDAQLLPGSTSATRKRRRIRIRRLAIMIRFIQVAFFAIVTISTIYFIYSLNSSKFNDNFTSKISASSERAETEAKRHQIKLRTSELPLLSNNSDISDITYTRPLNASTTTSDPMEVYRRFTGECRLPKIDPFDEDILARLDSSVNPLRDCVPQEGLRTYLDEQDVVKVAGINDTTIKCYFRALYQYSDKWLAKGSWVEIDLKKGVKIYSDIIETGCYNNAQERITIDLHWTIIPKENPKSNEESDRPPDVFIILLDSVSNSQMYRSLPKTLKFLNESLGATSFEYVNKVGLNSRPNANAMLLGMRTYDLHQSPFGPIVQFERELCNTSINREDYIGFNYKNMGYKTLMAEDWAMGVFNYYRCTGFYDAPPAEHYMRPFQLRMEEETYADMVKYIFDPKCLEYHHVLMNYTEKFMNKYPHDPKFSITWMSEIAHDDSNGLYRTDDFFLDFFKRNEKKFDNSFVFFMGDHGRRYGPVKDTKYGALEDYNPALKIIVPKKLRANKEFMKNMQINSKKLISHYDFYATLVEIYKYGPEWNENTTFGDVLNSHWNRDLIGSSFFHPMKEPRNCATLLIPFEFCICDFGKHEVEKPEIAILIAEKAIGLMNSRLQEHDVAKVACAALRLNTNEKLRLQEEDVFGKAVFQVDFTVSPSGGLYYATAEVETLPNGDYKVEMISDEFPRKDRYEEQAKCVDDKRLKNYCYCKSK
ncbi:unnamed protein product [Bursaphelenchus xylophilus]|uniref:(pine wood nematode) hypothetical protein n=1 Tax=Bursaphelenchus xylophilus TaxID=6326 RepID=A0A1I7RNM4_BURXY|nr:unnamed protein product [Bursaphelenchus xylophilus]CAG9124160.1 unnamed protein product [Bursaphelenchus xylophilus]